MFKYFIIHFNLNLKSSWNKNNRSSGKSYKLSRYLDQKTYENYAPILIHTEALNTHTSLSMVSTTDIEVHMRMEFWTHSVDEDFHKDQLCNF